MNTLKLSTKLVGQLTVQFTLLILCGLAGLSGLKAIYGNQVEITEQLVPCMNYLRSVSVDIHQALLAERSLCILDHSSENFASNIKDYEKNLRQIDKRFSEFLAINQADNLDDLIADYEKGLWLLAVRVSSDS